MPQDRESGADAVKYGLETAKIIGHKLGATKEGRSNSNEYLLKGKHIVIKCARHKNDSVGISYQMLKKLDSILGPLKPIPGHIKFMNYRHPNLRNMKSRQTAKAHLKD